MSSGLREKVSEIEACIALIDHLYDRLRYLQPTVMALLRSSMAIEQTGKLAFLGLAQEYTYQGTAFPAAWKAAVKSKPGRLGIEECELISSLGDILGGADLESQLGALSYARAQMEVRLETARTAKEKNGKLYSTLGVLCGAALAIISI